MFLGSVADPMIHSSHQPTKTTVRRLNGITWTAGMSMSFGRTGAGGHAFQCSRHDNIDDGDNLHGAIHKMGVKLLTILADYDKNRCITSFLRGCPNECAYFRTGTNSAASLSVLMIEYSSSTSE
jgi:hypothetical protein